MEDKIKMTKKKDSSEKFEKVKFSDMVIDLKRVDFSDILELKNPIVFDTNFLFVTFSFKIDIISEVRKVIGSDYSLFIYEGTLGELCSVERKGDKNKKFLPLIARMLKIYGFKIIKSEKHYIDDQILENLDKRVVVATNDKELRLSIQKEGFKVLYLRQKSYLEMN